MSATTKCINYLLNNGVKFTKFPNRKELLKLLIITLQNNNVIKREMTIPKNKKEVTIMFNNLEKLVPNKFSCKTNIGMLNRKPKEPAVLRHLPNNWTKEFIYSVEFLRTIEWKRLRVDAIELYGNKCQMCGASPPEITINVDHIIPRRIRPDLCLTLENLQILCSDCNMGKGNRYSTSYK